MESQLYRGLVLVLYQLSLLLGIALLPIALVAGRLGVPLPIHKVVLGLERRYARAVPN